MAEPLEPQAGVRLDDGALGEAAGSTRARATAHDGTTAQDGAADYGRAGRSDRAAAFTGEALRATAGWAVPLQWGAIVLSGGIAVVLAATHRWRSYDWLFVLLCGLYVVNAVGFRLLSKRGVR